MNYFKAKRIFTRSSFSSTSDNSFRLSKEIEKDFRPNECLNYLNNLFKQFECMVQVKHVSSGRMNALWLESSTVAKSNFFRSQLEYVNQHENFKEMKLYISKNLDNFNHKEIALVTKMYKSINLNANEELVEDLDNYCIKNREMFDLYDLGNISDSIKLSYRESNLAKKTNILVYKMLIDDVAKVEYYEKESFINDIFELKMSELDLSSNNNLWLKLLLLRKYRGIFKSEWITAVIQNSFKRGLANLKNIDSPEYKVNFLTSLLHCSFFISKNLEDFPDQIFENSEFIREYLFDDYIKNFDLVHYKFDLLKSFRFFEQANLLKHHHIESLLQYVGFKLKTDDITNVEYFVYLNILYDLTSITGNCRPNTININSVLKSHDLESTIREKNLYFMNNLDPLCFAMLKKGIHVMNSAGEIDFVSLYQKIKECSEVPNIFQFIIPTILPSILSYRSKSFKEHEIELSRLLVEKYQFIENDEIGITFLLINIVSFIMANIQSNVMHFDFIMKSMRNDVIKNCAFLNLLPVIKGLQKNLKELCVHDKKNMLSLIRMLLTKLANDMVYSIDINAIRSILATKHFLSILTNLKNYYFLNLISIKELNKVHSSFKTTTLEDIESNDVQNLCKRDTKQDKFLYLDERLSLLVQLAKESRCYSIDFLDETWSLLNEFLKSDLSCGKNYVLNFVNIISLFQVFDYTTSRHYNNEIVVFQQMCLRFYSQNRHVFSQDINLLSSYLSSLLNLNCYDDEAFSYYLKLCKNVEISNFIQHRNIIWFMKRTQNMVIDRKLIRSNFFIVNEKFLKDFNSFLNEYKLRKDEFEVIQNENEDLMIFVHSSKLHIPIWLIDRIHNYQNKDGLLKQYSTQIKLAEQFKLSLILIQENEFYNDPTLIFEKKLREINLQ